MEGLTTVKVSDLTQIFEELSKLRSEIKKQQESEDDLKAYSIQQTAKMLSLHYNSVRKLVVSGKLFAKYLEGASGKCMIPLSGIKAYLKSKENSNH